MLKNLRKNKVCSDYRPYLLFMIVIFLFSCKKTDGGKTEKAENPAEFSYEVTCDYCDISYTDMSNQNRIIKNNKGSWVYKINTNITFDLKLSVKTSLSSAQTIQAYILKDNEVIYGNLGYNFADISYSTQLGNGTSSFGNYTNSGSGGGNGTGGTTTPISSVCGAKNKTGGYCKRIVVGGGRCWQHK